MVIVDTSVWIEVFRRKAPLDLDEYVEFDDIVTCLPVIQEVLQGFRDESAFRKARSAMLSLPVVESPMTLETFEAATGLYRAAPTPWPARRSRDRGAAPRRPRGGRWRR